MSNGSITGAARLRHNVKDSNADNSQQLKVMNSKTTESQDGEDAAAVTSERCYKRRRIGALKVKRLSDDMQAHLLADARVQAEKASRRAARTRAARRPALLDR